MNKQILLIEDDLSSQAILKRMVLRIEPETEISCVQSAESALRLINDAGAGRPGIDLVMADLTLPGSSGLALWGICTTLHPSLEFLFISGVSHEEWIRKIARFQDWPPFIRKPVAEKDLRRFWNHQFYGIGEAAS